MQRLFGCRWMVVPLAVGCALMLRAEETKPREVALLCVHGIECGGCFYSVQMALAQAKGVEEAEVFQSFEDFARMVYDPKVTTEHQMADAVYDAIQLHADPYTATLKLHIPKYAEHAAAVDRLFEGWKEWVKLEVEDRAQGMLRVHFEPLKGANEEGVARGWSVALLAAAMKAAGPNGGALAFDLPKPGEPAP